MFKAGFLIQFTLCGIHRVFAFLYTSCWNLYCGETLSMTILTLHKEFSFLRYGYHIAELGIFQYVEILYLRSSRQLDVVASGCQPWSFV